MENRRDVGGRLTVDDRFWILVRKWCEIDEQAIRRWNGLVMLIFSSRMLNAREIFEVE